MGKERLAEEYLSPKLMTKSVTEIIKKFTKRVLFYYKYSSSKIMNMTQYLSMLRTEIRKFMVKSKYQTLLELQSQARRSSWSLRPRREVRDNLQSSHNLQQKNLQRTM